MSRRQLHMDDTTALLLFAAGFAGGIVTAVVGGASLITFPALLAAGLPPVVAVATNAVATTPASFAAAATDRHWLPAWQPAFWRVFAVATIGSGAGALLLIFTPERALMTLVPLLIGMATAVYAFAGRIRAWIFRHAADPAVHSARADRVGLVLLAPTAIYIGYFGAGAAVMLLAILSLGHDRDFRTANVLKNLLAGVTSVVAVLVFIVSGSVAWPQTTAMMAGSVAGGYAGARMARIIPAPFVRVLVIVVGCVVTAVYAQRYWSSTPP
jgi:uncharacterized membrane protein YfcA